MCVNLNPHPKTSLSLCIASQATDRRGNRGSWDGPYTGPSPSRDFSTARNQEQVTLSLLFDVICIPRGCDGPASSWSDVRCIRELRSCGRTARPGSPSCGSPAPSLSDAMVTWLGRHLGQNHSSMGTNSSGGVKQSMWYLEKNWKWEKKRMLPVRVWAVSLCLACQQSLAMQDQTKPAVPGRCFPPVREGLERSLPTKSSPVPHGPEGKEGPDHRLGPTRTHHHTHHRGGESLPGHTSHKPARNKINDRGITLWQQYHFKHAMTFTQDSAPCPSSSPSSPRHGMRSLIKQVQWSPRLAATHYYSHLGLMGPLLIPSSWTEP